MRSPDDILQSLCQREDCSFWPAFGLPTLPSGLLLPPDLATFYTRFGGCRLFGTPTDPRYELLPPRDFVQIGIPIWGQPTREPLQESWFALANVRDGDFIAIDCHPSRLGYCYDAFHETLDDLACCQVIAHGFTEFLHRSCESRDEAWWLGDRFPMYGYADALR